MIAMEDKEYLSREDMYELLGCGEKKLREYVRDHKLPTPVRRNRKHFWFRTSVEVAIAKMRAATEKNLRASAFQP